MSASGPLPDRAWIAARIPHAGRMCLLDRVLAWDGSRIHCLARSHTDAGHPLALDGTLGMANGIEYAAQAMAVHGALLAGSETAPAAGFLTSVRDVQWDGARLDTLGPELQVHAERLSGDAQTILYGFRLEAEGRTVLSGRASVMLDAGAP
ncbi:MAG: hydroxymyristoyl-ACP dehydratase [Hylemonella sp.]|uniref:hydroxymyristoyl-ACP dehydratase n=1 Tax=Hylemonella sp. TaxID=2066020 RepID=UPI00391CAAC8